MRNEKFHEACGLRNHGLKSMSYMSALFSHLDPYPMNCSVLRIPLYIKTLPSTLVKLHLEGYIYASLVSIKNLLPLLSFFSFILILFL